MRQLRGRRRGPEGRDDRGAVATIFAMLLVFGVLLGFMALVIDVGQLYVEREELQSGADAAAVAIGKACSEDTAGCEDLGAIEDLAQQYADDNARDGVSSIEEICGHLPGILAPCTVPASNLTACLDGPENPPPAPALYVEVRVHTEMPDGQFALPPVFAQTMAGNETFDGAQVGACARASWEPAEDVTLLAMTISTCEYNTATDGGDDFVDPPPYPPNPSRFDEYEIDFRWSGDLFGGHSTCGPDPPGQWDRPGPAGWLNGNGSCELTMPDDNEVRGPSPLIMATFPSNCRNRVSQAIANREVLYVPVHEARDPGVTAVDYRVVSVAPVVFTGSHLAFSGSGNVPSWLWSPPRLPCNSLLDRCVAGVFVGEAIPIDDLHGDAIVTLIG